VDWLVSDAMGKERTPSASFIPAEEVRSEGAASDAEDRLPSVSELIAARPREAGATLEGERGQTAERGQTGSLPYSENLDSF